MRKAIAFVLVFAFGFAVAAFWRHSSPARAERLDLSQFPGLLGDRIQACHDALPFTGGVCDGSELRGLPWGPTPVTISKTGVAVKLGPGLYPIASGVNPALTVSPRGIFFTLECERRARLQVNAGTASVFSIGGNQSRWRNCELETLAGSNRSGKAWFALEGGQGGMDGIRFTGAPGVNNGQGINCVSENCDGWFFNNIEIAGGVTWEYILKMGAAMGTTAASHHFNNWFGYGNVYTEAALVFESCTDTVLLSQIEVGGKNSKMMAIRDTLGCGKEPRWIHCFDCRTEAANSGVALDIDAGQDIRFIGCYIASSARAADISGGREIEFANCVFKGINRQAFLFSSSKPRGVSIHDNDFVNCGVEADNKYDCIGFAAHQTDFRVESNYFRNDSPNHPRYWVTIGAGASDRYHIRGNTWGSSAGTGNINDLGTGTKKVVAQNIP